MPGSGASVVGYALHMAPGPRLKRASNDHGLRRTGALADAHRAAAQHRWLDAYRSLRNLDARGALAAEDLEVLRLLAMGLSNRAIAEELTVTVRTVEAHVGRVLDKLGVSSRSAATSFAHRHGLA